MSDLNVERDGAILVLTMNRPERLNALSVSMREGIVGELTRELQAPGVRAVLLTGAGKGFCSGADLEPDNMLGGTSSMAGRIQAGINKAIQLIRDLPLPVIAAVNGAAAGAGAGLALAADLMLMTPNAKLHFSFSSIGLVMDAGVSHALTRKLGSARTSSLAMMGGKIDAKTAFAWGLAHSVIDAEDFDGAARAFARTVADRPTVALGLMKRQIRLAETATLEDVLRSEAALQGIAAGTEDFREGVAAFNEKRPAKFQGK